MTNEMEMTTARESMTYFVIVKYQNLCIFCLAILESTNEQNITSHGF